MSDADLRGLERRWRDTDSIEDFHAAVKGRLRNSPLKTRRLLRAAALLGAPHASAVLSDLGEVPPLNDSEAYLAEAFEHLNEEELLRIVTILRDQLLPTLLEVRCDWLAECRAAIPSLGPDWTPERGVWDDLLTYDLVSGVNTLFLGQSTRAKRIAGYYGAVLLAIRHLRVSGSYDGSFHVSLQMLASELQVESSDWVHVTTRFLLSECFAET